MSTLVQVLMVPGCGHGEQTGRFVREVLEALDPAARMEVIIVRDQADAERQRFPGSPTVRVNRSDIAPDAPVDVGVG